MKQTSSFLLLLTLCTGVALFDCKGADVLQPLMASTTDAFLSLPRPLQCGLALGAVAGGAYGTYKMGQYLKKEQRNLYHISAGLGTGLLALATFSLYTKLIGISNTEPNLGTAFFSGIWIYSMLPELPSIYASQEEPVNTCKGMSDYIGRIPNELKALIIYAKNADVRKKQREKKIEPPTGFLLYGSPGLGKTHLALCLAAEMEVPYRVLHGRSDLAQGGEHNMLSRLQNVWMETQALAKRSPRKLALLIMDEADSLLGSRKAAAGHSAAWLNSYNGIVNASLSHMSAQSHSDGYVVVIACTNFTEWIDNAIRRSGRLQELELPLPSRTEIKKIFELYLTKMFPTTSSTTQSTSQEQNGATISDICNNLDADYLYGTTPAEITHAIKAAARELLVLEDPATAQTIYELAVKKLSKRSR